MTETPAETAAETAETRGGQDPDWAAVRPGEPLPDLPGPETAGGGEDG